MNDPWPEQEQVGIESIFVIMYGGKSVDNLTKLRFLTIHIFLQKLLRVYIFPNLVALLKNTFLPAKIYNYGKMKIKKTFW